MTASLKIRALTLSRTIHFDSNHAVKASALDNVYKEFSKKQQKLSIVVFI